MAKRETLEQYLKRCRERVHRSAEWRRTEGYDDLWKRMIDLYKGKVYEDVSDEDRTQVNIAFATANVIYPMVSVSSPKFIASPTKPEMVQAAALAEAGVNYWWRHYRFLPEWRAAVKDSIIIGHGWVKTGYRYVEEEQPRPQEEIDAELAELLAQRDEAAFEEGVRMEDLPDEDDVRAQIPTKKMVVVEDRPFVERVSPFDMFIDPDATCERELKWIAQRIIMDWESFKEDPRFSEAAKEKVQKRDLRRDQEDRNDFGRRAEADREQGYVHVYEYYDLRRGTMCMFADTGDQFLVKPTRVPLPYNNPFTLIPNYEVPEYFYPIGDLEGIEVLQKELNLTRSQMFNDRKRFIPKYLAKKGAFDEEAKKILKSDVHNAIAEVESSENLRDVFQPVPQTDVRPELYQQSDLIKGDINDVSGVSDYQRGALPEIRRTATEASIIQDTANARAADKLAQIEWRLAEVGYRLLQLAQTHMDGELVARITGEDGSMQWVTFTPDDIMGEFDFEVEMGSTKPSNESTKAQRAMQLIDAISPWLGTGLVNEPEMIKHILYSFGVRDPDRFIGSGAPPMPPEEELPPGELPPEGLPPEMLAEGGAAPPDMSLFDPQMMELQSSFSGVQG